MINDNTMLYKFIIIDNDLKKIKIKIKIKSPLRSFFKQANTKKM